MELNLLCAGACFKPIFYVTKSIHNGSPRDGNANDCIYELIQEFRDLLAPAIVCSITAVILLLAIFGAIPLCSGLTKSTDDKMQTYDTFEKETEMENYNRTNTSDFT